MCIIFFFASSIFFCLFTYQNDIYRDLKAEKPQINNSNGGIVKWTENGIGLCTADENQEDPKVIGDGQGGAIITWGDYRNGSNWDIYAQRINKAGDELWTINGTAICTAIGDQIELQLVSDGQGGAIITWEDHRSGSNYDIYAQRINSNGVVNWMTNGIAICTASNYQCEPQLVSDGQGGAIISWEDYRSGSNYDIYAQRINKAGDELWTINGVAICTTIGHQYDSRLVSDGMGGAIISWEDLRIEWDIYAQRINSKGVVNWTANGIAICTEPAQQYELQLVSDGQGGAIITWQDWRIVSTVDLYAQRINSKGIVNWTTNGVPVCTASDNQRYQQLVCDGQGGAIVTWEDSRGSDVDIYAQRVNSNGAVNWTIDGIPVGIATNTQTDPQIVMDGKGGAIITWGDYRNGNFDIYAQHIGPNSGILWTSDGIPICTATGTQKIPQLVYNEGVIFAWQDERAGSSVDDIYIQRVVTGGDAPKCSTIADIDARVGGTAYINWTLTDDFGPGHYQILVNEQPSTWNEWTNGETVNYHVNTSVVGLYNYTIQYNDSAGQFGDQDTVLVAIGDSMFIEIINETHSEDIFNITFQLLDSNRNGINGAAVQYWWNGVEWTGNMTELGNGLYRINVSSIVVGSRDTTVKLNMTITKAGYTSLYYEKIVLFYADDDDGNLLNQVLDWITTPTGMIIVIGSFLGLVILITILLKRRK